MINYSTRSTALHEASDNHREAASALAFADLPAGLACASAHTDRAAELSAARLTDLTLRCALAAAGAGASIVAGAIDRPREAAPRLATDSANGPHSWRLSLSHSGSLLVTAAARGLAVGIDTEMHRDRDIARLTRFLRWGRGADGQQASLSAQAFYLRWTLAEALFKAGAAPSAACYSAADQSLGPAVDVATTGHRLTIADQLWEARYRCDAEDPATRAGSTTTCVVWSPVLVSEL